MAPGPYVTAVDVCGGLPVSEVTAFDSYSIFSWIALNSGSLLFSAGAGAAWEGTCWIIAGCDIYYWFWEAGIVTCIIVGWAFYYGAVWLEQFEVLFVWLD